MIHYTGYMLVVEEMDPIKQFYAGLLQQKLKFDSPDYVVFEGEFSLFLKRNFRAILGDEERFPIQLRANNGELYFESDDIEADERRLMQAGTEFIHGVKEQPWGQRVMRFYDPSGAVVEIGEEMGVVIRRYQAQGMSLPQISERIGFTVPMLEEILAKG